MYDELIFVYIQVLSAEYNVWKNMLSGQNYWSATSKLFSLSFAVVLDDIFN